MLIFNLKKIDIFKLIFYKLIHFRKFRPGRVTYAYTSNTQEAEGQGQGREFKVNLGIMSFFIQNMHKQTV